MGFWGTTAYKLAIHEGDGGPKRKAQPKGWESNVGFTPPVA